MRPLPYEHPGTPELSSPMAFLGWVGRGQWRTLVVGVAFGILWMVAQALIPATISQAIDQGIIAGDSGALWRWSAALLGLAALTALAGAARHQLAVTNWLRAAFRSVQLIGWHGANTGEALPRDTPTGDVVAAVASDSMRLGGLYDVTARFAGAIVSYVVVAIILLRASQPLGLVVLIGVPVLVGLLSFIVRPLQRRQAQQREESGRLIGLGADTVAGLRVLRGIGGEATFLNRYAAQSQQVREVGFRVAGMQAALDSAQVLLPGVFVVLVTWLGARFAIDGRITPGQLVAFYGYSAFLVMPLRTATEFVDRATRAFIGARKIIKVLRVEPDHVDSPDTATASMPPRSALLVDQRSGLVVQPGQFLAVVSGRPEESAALADRLGRFGTDVSGVTLGGIPLTDLPLRKLRQRILVSETDPRLFTGTLREELDPSSTHQDAEILDALAVASGEDVLEALADGLDSEVEERGRSFSGGQRQRLVLTRALLAEAPILVLVEPTSAVDAHTETRIAARLAEFRAGETTVVMTASPLVLDRADRVVLLDEGRVVAEGTHHELMHRGDEASAAYRAVVVRGADEEARR
ncbi:ABC transporter ATP-binding protein [Phycicoccus elongatus]|uniref:ABC transporter ATP-binding protein n=1 Tax=Phycicoccus elongatus TaxID=101689 RepID=UPI0037849BC6